MTYLAEFAEKRGVKKDTISAYIRRHNDEFRGHVDSSTKGLYLDAYAELMLEKVYPLPKPVEVIIDHESRDKLIKAQEFIIALQEGKEELRKHISELEHDKYLIEQKNLKQDLQISELKAIHQQESIELHKQINDLKLQLEQEKSKTWWQKLIKK